MEFVHHRDPYYTVIYGFYSDTELVAIWAELARLNNESVLSSNPADTAGAYEDKLAIAIDPRQAGHKTFLKLNYGKFLDDLYAADRSRSAILTTNQRVIEAHPEYRRRMETGENPFNTYLFHINFYTTLLNYYEENHYYSPHIDGCCLTAISYFWKEPRRFEGGDFVFADHDHTVRLENNSVIVFPSFQKHAVSPVNLKPGVATRSLNGRFAISQFLSHNFVPKRKAPAAAPTLLDKLGLGVSKS